MIVDEIHAVAADKRGAHLALSLERLDALVGPAKLQRIGLSATVRPLEVAARLLVGSRPLPEIVDVGQRRDLDLAVMVPEDELGAVCTNEQWGELYDRVAALAREHKSTLVFVNTRRLVERVTLHLAERLGADTVAAHHGSLSRERRHRAERRLKEGDLRVVVATASLELGIDVGAVELDVPDRFAPIDLDGAAAHRAIGPRVAGDAEGPPVPAHPRSAGRVRGPRACRAARRDRRCLSARRAARRDGAADRRHHGGRGVGRGPAVRDDPTGGAVRGAGAQRLRRRRRHAFGGHRDQPRAGGRDGPPRRGQPEAARAARRPAGGADVGRCHPRQRELRRRAGARGHGDRQRRRGLRDRVDGGRHHPARQLVVAHPARRARAGSRRGRGRRARRRSRSGWARGRRARASCRPRSRRCARRSRRRLRAARIRRRP